jgi:hypothetical protein
MRRIISLTTIVTALVACGLVHGLWTDRWVSAHDVTDQAARMNRVTLALGDWQGQELDITRQPNKEIAGHLYRRYINRRSGETVTVALVAGRPGPVAIHTPDACYAASGYQVGTPVKQFVRSELPGRAAEFWTAPFVRTRAADRSQLRIFWSWSATGAWTVPSTPRVAFARYPVLYKLYVIREVADPDQPVAEDPCLDLLRVLLPDLHKSLFAES